MFRQALAKAPRLSTPSFTSRAFSTSIHAMAEGDTGATRMGGSASGDAFTKREQALENYTIQQREKEKFLALKRQIKEQQDHLKKLSEHLEDIQKDKDGK